MKYRALALTLVTLGYAEAAVVSSPVFNPTTGHHYYLLSQSTWTEARAESILLGGDLAVINNAAENDWIYNTFSNFGGLSRRLWIGLTDQAQEGVFRWVDGSTPSYTNWFTSQPDNGSGGLPEHFVHLDGPTDIYPSQWNDLPDVVLGTYGVAEVIPEPSIYAYSLVILTTSILRRKRRA